MTVAIWARKLAAPDFDRKMSWMDKFPKCTKGSQCSTGLCHEGRCHASEEGYICNPGNAKSCRHDGAVNLRCSSRLGRCVKESVEDKYLYKDEGKTCKSYSDCKAGQYCDNIDSGRSCKDRVKEGSACHPASMKFEDECEDGLICSTKTNKCKKLCRDDSNDCSDTQKCVFSNPIPGVSHIGLCEDKPAPPPDVPPKDMGSKPVSSGEAGPKKEDKPSEPAKSPSEATATPEKPASSETTKPVKTKPKAKKPSSQEAESEEEADASVPAVTPGDVGKELPKTQGSLLKFLGLSNANTRQLAFYAATACAAVLLLVILIVWIVARVRRSRKQRAEKKRDLETVDLGHPASELPRYEELEQQGSLSQLPVAMEKGAGEKKGQ